MSSEIRLLSIDFDGTLVSRVNEPVLDDHCMKLIRDLQKDGVLFAINTGRSVDLLESGLADFSFPMRPNFILTSERDVFRPGQNGEPWEAFGDWNQRCAREHAELLTSVSSVIAEVIDFVNQKTEARVIYEPEGPAGVVASSDEEMDRVTTFHKILTADNADVGTLIREIRVIRGSALAATALHERRMNSSGRIRFHASTF